MVIDIVVRCVPSYGYLPIVTVDGKEVYRGEFQPDAQSAFERAEQIAERSKGK